MRKGKNGKRKNGKRKGQKIPRRDTYYHTARASVPDAIVPRSLVEQARAFTAPRGRLEMGGLLVGHIDDQGRNVCVAGFFPEQTEATPGYCEFDGSWMAICANAIRLANEGTLEDGTGVPAIRIIGWIHTHPGLGIFLSGTDQRTYRDNMASAPDGRFLAVVVDPLKGEDGVFTTPDRPRDYTNASGSLEMGEDLRSRYLSFLSEMEKVRLARGENALPFIITGDLRREHVSKGHCDDYSEAYLRSIPAIQGSIKRLEDSLGETAEVESKRDELLASLESMIERNRSEIARIRSEIGEMVESLEKKLFDGRMGDQENIPPPMSDIVGHLESMRDSILTSIEVAISDFTDFSGERLRSRTGRVEIPEEALLEAEA